jgi:predicted RNase H-like HicB family nuclease
MTNLRVPLRIVFYPEAGSWVAHCLEFDLAGDGTTKEAALMELSEAIRLQIEATVEHGNFRNLFTPADGEVFAKFAAGKDITLGELHIAIEPVHIDQAQMREYAAADLLCA